MQDSEAKILELTQAGAATAEALALEPAAPPAGRMGGQEASAAAPGLPFSRLVAEELQQVEARLLGLCTGADEAVSAAARAAVEAGGKRLRPMLVLLSARVIGETTEDTLALAIAVETMHLASLMHDDVVDEAPKRRGQPTVRGVWGNRAAVFVGDYLATRAYRDLSRLATTQYVELLAEVAVGMCVAEAGFSQIPAEELTEGSCLTVAHGKTAALMGACCQAGALSAGAEEPAATALRDYGDHLGLAFQIADDLLDIYGDERALGKAPGRDLLTRQYTLPVIHALHGERSEEVRLAIAAFQARGGEEELAEVGRLLADTGSRRHAEVLARAHVDQAKAALRSIAGANPEAVEALGEMAEYVVSRGR